MSADVIWLMGLSGSGKTTLAARLLEHLRAAGKRAELIDGDAVRDFFDDRAYSPQGRRLNVKRIAFAAMLLARHDVTVVVANISPFDDVRRFVRSRIPRYHEIYLTASLEDCERRDVKGIYARARRGEASQVVGLDAPFEPPSSPHLRLSTGAQPPERSFGLLVDYLRSSGVL